MNHLKQSLITLFFLTLCLNQPAFAQFDSLFGSSKTVPQQREEILKKSQQILKNLYAVEPKAKEVIEIVLAGGPAGVAQPA